MLRRAVLVSRRKRAHRIRALKHGHYFSGCFDRKQYLSPLYGAKIYTGELSGEYKFMKPLSEKLHKDPAFGKVLWDIGHDLDFSQPQ